MDFKHLILIESLIKITIALFFIIFYTSERLKAIKIKKKITEDLKKAIGAKESDNISIEP